MARLKKEKIRVCLRDVKVAYVVANDEVRIRVPPRAPKNVGDSSSDKTRLFESRYQGLIP